MKNATRARVLCGLFVAVSCVPAAKLHEDEQHAGSSGAGAAHVGGIGGKPVIGIVETDGAGMAGEATGGVASGGAGEGGEAPATAGGEAGAGGASPSLGFAVAKFCNNSATPNTGEPIVVWISQGDTHVEFSASPGECVPAANEPCRTIPAGEVWLSEVIDGVPQPWPGLGGQEPTEVFEGEARLFVLGHSGNQGGSIVGPFAQPLFCASATFDSLFPSDCPRPTLVLGPPSCACLDSDVCGSKTNCCSEAGEVGGIFNRGNDPNAPARVSPFGLDTYEISVGRFRRFVEHYAQPEAGSGKNLNDAEDQGWDAAWSSLLPQDGSALGAAVACDPNGQQTWTAEAGSNEGMPMNCLTWFEAQAFCIWDGGRLPTEAEWNYAAAAGDEQRLYPWSEPPTNPTSGTNYANYASDGSTPSLLPLGSKGAGQSSLQHEDLAGNVAEWVEDWYAPGYTKPCHDCGAAGTGTERAVRGGSYLDPAPAMLTSYRASAKPDQRSPAVGARCARPAP
jgi:sulfatase modifying factor 1